jgi:hypothetical protein
VAGYKKNLINPYLYKYYSNSASDLFQMVMCQRDDAQKDSAMSVSTDGPFDAYCLSGIRTDDNTGKGADATDAKLVDGFLWIAVYPDTNIAKPGDPRAFNTPEAIVEAIDNYKAVGFWARSNHLATGGTQPAFGQKITMYFEEGSIKNSDWKKPRFLEPVGVPDFGDSSFRNLASVLGISTAINAFDNGYASLLGSPVGTSDTTSPAQLAFIDKLGKALRGKGLKFHVTDRSRTVDDQMNRIMNKYKNNSPAEVITAYREGAAMVKAIQSNDTATFRKLAGRSSKHLKGNAIDIRSKWYTDDEIPIVLGIIREVGGNPLLENIKGCWTAAGRNVTTTKRVQGAKPGGRGKNTPCHNEHIHIDIPEDFK